MVILGHVGKGLHAGAHLHDRVEAHALAFAHHALGHAQHIGRLAADAGGEAAHLIHQLGLRHQAGNKAPGKGGCRIYRIAGEEKFGGARMADGARQYPRAAIAGHQPDAQERGSENRVIGGDAHIG